MGRRGGGGGRGAVRAEMASKSQREELMHQHENLLYGGAGLSNASRKSPKRRSRTARGLPSPGGMPQYADRFSRQGGRFDRSLERMGGHTSPGDMPVQFTGRFGRHGGDHAEQSPAAWRLSVASGAQWPPLDGASGGALVDRALGAGSAKQQPLNEEAPLPGDDLRQKREWAVSCNYSSLGSYSSVASARLFAAKAERTMSARGLIARSPPRSPTGRQISTPLTIKLRPKEVRRDWDRSNPIQPQ